MCHRCRFAGQINADANMVVSACAAEYLRELASGEHDMCPDLNCTCQHVTGVVINTMEAEPD